MENQRNGKKVWEMRRARAKTREQAGQEEGAIEKRECNRFNGRIKISQQSCVDFCACSIFCFVILFPFRFMCLLGHTYVSCTTTQCTISKYLVPCALKWFRLHNLSFFALLFIRAILLHKPVHTDGFACEQLVHWPTVLVQKKNGNLSIHTWCTHRWLEMNAFKASVCKHFPFEIFEQHTRLVSQAACKRSHVYALELKKTKICANGWL